MANARIPATNQVVAVTAATASSAALAKSVYVNKVAPDGWLQVLVDGTTLRLSLCKYTRLTALSVSGGRSHFKVMDGAAQGRLVSLTEANAKEFLGGKAPVAVAATAVVTYGKYVEGWVSEARGGQKLDQQMAMLEVAGIKVQVVMNSVWDTGFTPLPAGHYAVLLPDSPHNKDMTRFYRKFSPALTFDQVWFPIRYGDNSRYVHIGNVSDGCVTVLDMNLWADVHEALISHRDKDGRGVAVLTVKGTPGRAK